MAAKDSKRILVCGDVDGDLEKLYGDVEKQMKQHGKFDMLFACGKFLPSSKAQNAGLQKYVTGQKDVPIPTYFIDSESGVFMKTASAGRKLGKTSIEFLGSYGVKEIEGLRVGYISGKYNKDVYEQEGDVGADGRPMHIENSYTRAIVEQLKEDCGTQPLDLFISCEWPEGLDANITENDPPSPEFCSPAITDLCLAVEPRFHIFGLSGLFVRCKPYMSNAGSHVCRPVGLGKVGGPKGKHLKCLHALIVVPGTMCNEASLKRGSQEATPCPYSLDDVSMSQSPAAIVPAPKAGMKRTPPVTGALPPRAKPRVAVEKPGHKIRKDGMRTILDISLGKGKKFSIETGEVFKQAGGAVVVRDGDTQVWGTCCAAKKASDKDFMPLSVEYKEKTSGVGKTPGGFIKRDKPMCEDHEVLVCRFTDRPLRPLFPDTWNFETQILLFTMGFDGEHPPEPLAICAASASTYISDIPLKRPIAGCMVVMMEDGEYLVNPTIEERKNSKMQVMVAGTTEAVSMIEMSGDFVTEDQFLDGVMVGHEALKVICNGLVAFNEAVGKEKRSVEASSIPPQLSSIVERKYGAKIDRCFRSLKNVSNTEHEEKLSAIVDEAVKELGIEEGVDKPLQFEKKDVTKCIKKLNSLKLMNLIKTTGFRPDGRRPDEVRDIDVKQRYIPTCHGSSLFTRGDTQTVATATLGDTQMQQKQESVVDPHRKRFYLQYAFPPSCVGDVRRMTRGRREVGHGNLAERSVMPSLPSAEEFPYTIRTESFITESCGSSSMASVCGASLAMHNAGVPVKCLVSGIAMGMVDTSSGVASEEAIILSDIAELEDFIGKMDFKVAGNEDGLSAVQLDVKNEGLTRPLFARALEQARESRLHILNEMKKHVDMSQPVELPANVPKIIRLQIHGDAKGKIIGPGGSNIRKLIEEFNLTNICVSDDDYCEISGKDVSVLNTVKMIIEDICQSSGPGGMSGRGGFISADTPRITITIPSNGKGKLIGKAGSTINGLIADFGLADIKINDDTNEVDIIGGDEEAREACKARIDSLYADGPGGGKGFGKGGKKGGKSGGHSGQDPDDTVTIPKNCLGRVIGKQGSTIKQIISEFELDDMKARDVGGEGVIDIYGGTPDGRECAIEKIRSLIEDSTPQANLKAPVAHAKMAPRPGFGKGTPKTMARPGQKGEGSGPIVPKSVGGGVQPKVSDDLKKKLQMEFANMQAGESKSYRLLPHEVRLAKDLAAAFEMPIEKNGQEYVVSRPMDDDEQF